MQSTYQPKIISGTKNPSLDSLYLQEIAGASNQMPAPRQSRQSWNPDMLLLIFGTSVLKISLAASKCRLESGHRFLHIGDSHHCGSSRLSLQSSSDLGFEMVH